MDMGKKIRYYREKYKLKIKDLHEKTDLSISYISEIERGVKNPTLETLSKLSNALGVNISEFIGKEQNVIYNIKLVMGDMTIKEFADAIVEKTGIPIPDAEDLKNYFEGEVTPSSGTLENIANYAGIEPDFFYKFNKDYTIEMDEYTKLFLKIRKHKLDINVLEVFVDALIKQKSP